MQEIDKIYNNIPVVAIRGSVVFPHTDTILSFGRKKSVAAVNKSFQTDKVISIFTQKDPRTQDPKAGDLYSVGTIATITQMMSTDNELHAVVRGQERIKLSKITSISPYLEAEVEKIQEDKTDDPKVQALAKKLASLFKKSINLGKQAEIMTVMRLVSGKVDPNELADQIASILDITTNEKQEILETFSIKSRIQKVMKLLAREVNILDIERTITSKTQKRFEDQMRKAMLREKKRTIEEELGEEDEDGSDEIISYRKKITKSKMPKDVKKKAKKELNKLSKLNLHSPEVGYIRNYLDWITDMPWGKLSTSDVEIKKAKKILNDDHHGLKKTKERILEYLAVMKVKKNNGKSAKKNKKENIHNVLDSQPTILCFIGPPGVGKTSIGKSIARALGRKFVRISLGGVRDEAEIRGHRRTYVGALPGRIIQGIKDAGTSNPVFMLDEVDKLGTDFRGDPSSALLEALDPEQNKEFSDHYLEVAYDLSKVMFICTGNVLDDIPPALKDRMEVITFPGYTQEEKFGIAKDFLWPKQLRLHGLDNKKIKINKTALDEVINRYTREAGVRDLERNLATICRKIARKIAEGKKFNKTITKTSLKKYLGPQKFTSLIAETKDDVGMSTGLGVTAAGGEIMFIEVALMPGKGKLTLTGKLGDVMQESAKAAFTWTKSHWDMLGLNERFSKNIDVHIHVPEGAVPKDGPSAGIALSTALVSALTGIPVKRTVAMTGEVTLRGRVLEIGGVKEKVIAAHRAGIKTIVLPKDNEKDLEDIPSSTKEDIEFVFAKQLEDVLSVSLKKWPITDKNKKHFDTRPSFLATN
ncbi:endopeptidase La [Candidatus Woesebacteria bacterium]|nr:endopeptidase La [Candidatus Woesebacteria bacterium]